MSWSSIQNTVAYSKQRKPCCHALLRFTFHDTFRTDTYQVPGTIENLEIHFPILSNGFLKAIWDASCWYWVNSRMQRSSSVSYNRALSVQQRRASSEVCELLLAMSDTKSPVPSARASVPNESKFKKRSRSGQPLKNLKSGASRQPLMPTTMCGQAYSPTFFSDPLLILFNTRKHQCHSNVWQEEK